jgi:opacity protein-like surface antigen
VAHSITLSWGADRFSDDDSSGRNLAFETRLSEFSLIGEYYLFNLYDQKFSPYLFAGLAVYHFDPYAYNPQKEKVFLKPLSTEGEGLSQYPDRKSYALTQMAIPFGAGVKYAFTDNLRLGLELAGSYLQIILMMSTSYVIPMICWL